MLTISKQDSSAAGVALAISPPQRSRSPEASRHCASETVVGGNSPRRALGGWTQPVAAMTSPRHTARDIRTGDLRDDIVRSTRNLLALHAERHCLRRPRRRSSRPASETAGRGRGPRCMAPPRMGSVLAQLRARRHTALLVSLVMLFAVRPLIEPTGAGPLAFSVVMLIVLLVALYNMEVEELGGDHTKLLAGRRRRRTVGWTLAVLAAAERLGVLVVGNENWYEGIGLASWFAFFAFVTAGELRNLVRHRTVTRETISMSVSVYLMLGVTWGLLYILIFLEQPGSFRFPEADEVTLWHTFPVFIYFILTTLSTIGYGDIMPVTLLARYAAVAEGIAGQFYLAILVARLVSMQIMASGDRGGR